MNNFNRNFVDDEGKTETIIATSNDDYELNMGKKYTLANHTQKKKSRLAEKFKGSILGADIGVKSSGFSTIAVLAAVIALAVLIGMYFLWRF